MPARRIGLFGGTFDPPHLGHVVVAAEAAIALDVDHVHVVPAGDPWQKSGAREISPASVRWAMVEAACQGHPGLVPSDVELRRGGPTRTIDTVEPLVAAGVEVVLVLGADAAAGLDSWHRADELAAQVEVAVVGRPGVEAGAPDGWRATAIHCPLIEISSTEIRRRCAAGVPIDHLVPDGVRAVIEANGLYGFGR